MKKRVKLKGRLKIYMQISMYLGLLLLLVDIGIYFWIRGRGSFSPVSLYFILQ